MLERTRRDRFGREVRDSCQAAMRLLKLLLLLFLCAVTVPVVAGPLEDGLAAYKRRDWATALGLLRPLAEQGDPAAQEKIGRLYERGKGLPKDTFSAAEWYRKAAEQGDAAAQGRLGTLYRTGEGVPRDNAEALKWYRKSSERGNPLAQVGLGYMSWGGEGLPVDYSLAATWFGKAAEHGDALGQLSLGTLYELGKGVPKDAVQAYKWYDLATVDDGEYEDEVFARARRSREGIAEKMTPAQVAKAQQLARELRAKLNQ
jgi:TPR repeat protein